jgi:hypothetical protein
MALRINSLQSKPDKTSKRGDNLTQNDLLNGPLDYRARVDMGPVLRSNVFQHQMQSRVDLGWRGTDGDQHQNSAG